MVSHLFFYQLVLVALVWLCLMLHWVWPSDSVAACLTTLEPLPPRRQRSREPKPFVGLTTKPHCDACADTSDPHPHAPAAPPPRIVMTRGRRRQIDAAHHFCPNPDCAYRGWVGWGNLRANGQSQWWPLAATTVCSLSPLFSGDPRYALAWQAGLCRAHRTRHRVPGRGAGHPGHGAGLRGRPQHGAAVAGGGGGAAPGLFPTRPARCAGPAGTAGRT